MVKKKKVKYIVLLIVFILLASVLLFIGYGVTTISRNAYTEESTYEYTAKFKSKEQGEDFWLLYVDKYNCALLVNSESILNEEKFNRLTDGDVISFRSVFKIEENNNNDKIPTSIVTLKTEDAEIVTLESYKLSLKPNETKIKITATVFASFFLIVALVCILFLSNVFPIKQKTGSE